MSALEPGDDTGQSWRRDSLCAQSDPELFFTDAYGKGVTRVAKQICRRCPVATECLEHALSANERFGIWGGHTALERSRILASRKFATAS
ncbi:WhiB family transcriptional regulator [Rhodococcus hoagii]|nr:WhiB family transcriptional regulator [Prescottella equi]MBM4654041.1 WhiB family transcriptional regulator [Prescottella equi]MBM4719696.1 WhiB family transcriptional regulator [Prescottella equi]NKR23493.1 WhiB family transcriptional regulator [Prescottella equi]NKT56353.1 WhiB family transcriptional regulator [Prescottella equi]